MPDVSQIGDKSIRGALQNLVTLERASRKWYWRLVGGLVATATIISATFQALSYFRS